MLLYIMIELIAYDTSFPIPKCEKSQIPKKYFDSRVSDKQAQHHKIKICLRRDINFDVKSKRQISILKNS